MSGTRSPVLAPQAPASRQRTATSVLLHLGPGAAAMAVYVAALPVARGLGLPSIAALAVSGLLGVLPVQLGIMALHRRRHSDPEINRLRARRPLHQLLLLSLVEVALGIGAFVLTGPLVRLVKAQAFGWWPASWVLDAGTHPGFSREALIVTAVLMLLGSVIAAPVVEEYYFRGFLLPRMPAWLGRGTPLAHAVLFAAYHLWTPWVGPARVLAILPLAYIARRTRDIRIGILTHVVLDAVDLALLVAFLLSG